MGDKGRFLTELEETALEYAKAMACVGDAKNILENARDSYDKAIKAAYVLDQKLCKLAGVEYDAEVV